MPNLKILVYFWSAWYIYFWFGRYEKFAIHFVYFVGGISWDLQTNLFIQESVAREIVVWFIVCITSSSIHRNDKEHANTWMNPKIQYIRGSSRKVYAWWRKYIYFENEQCTKSMSMNVAIIIIILWCCDDFPNASIYKMHGLMGSCESRGVLYVADLPGTKQLFV